MRLVTISAACATRTSALSLLDSKANPDGPGPDTSTSATGGSGTSSTVSCGGTTKLCNGSCIPVSDCCGGCSGNNPVCRNGICVARALGDALCNGAEALQGGNMVRCPNCQGKNKLKALRQELASQGVLAFASKDSGNARLTKGTMASRSSPASALTARPASRVSFPRRPSRPSRTSCSCTSAPMT